MELTEEEIKRLLKEQREICANQIKDMNFTLAEIVRIAPEPKVSRVELPVKPANDVIKIIDDMIAEKLTLIGKDANNKDWVFETHSKIIKYGYDLALQELKNRLSV